MKTLAVVLGLVLCAAAVQAQTKDAPKTDLQTKLATNHKLALAVLDIAGVTKAAENPKARYTFLLPTDAAIQIWLKDMGLTVDDLKKRPLLAKQLVAQHTLLRSNVRAEDIFAKENTRQAASLASVLRRNDKDLTFKRADGKATVTDAQGYTATVGKHITLDGQKTVLPIDRVLMGDDYYFTIADACKARAKTISAFCNAVQASGLTSALTPKGGLDATVFVPNNAAFAKVTSKPSAEALASILKYHVVSGARELPRQWKNGEAFPTLLDGKTLKVVYTVKTDAKRPLSGGLPFAEASVVPADGQGVRILKANVHVGKAVVHGIGSVLVPTATAAPVTTEKAPAAAAAKPAAAAAKPAAAAAAAPAAKTGSRKLMQSYGLEDRGMVTAEMDAASQAIANAVAGNESVAAAANKSLRGAEELSVPGAYESVMSGIDPW